MWLIYLETIYTGSGYCIRLDIKFTENFPVIFRHNIIVLQFITLQSSFSFQDALQKVS